MPVGREPAIVLICPNAWDELQLPRALQNWEPPFAIDRYGENPEYDPASFDALAFVENAVRDLGESSTVGVVSSSDYPGCLVAAVIAERLDLVGPTPQSMLRCSHKYFSRLSQQVAAPEATPRFALIDPNELSEASVPLPFPLFVKPVKSWFSQHARRIDTYEELVAFARSGTLRRHLSEFVRPLNQLLALYGFPYSGGFLIAEEVLTGDQFTLEGFLVAGVLTVVGIVDSRMYEGTQSFERFDYPSSTAGRLLRRMAEITERSMAEIGLTHGLFNIEFIHNTETDTVHIIEVNPRMCGQWADLMETVNGVNTYQVMLLLAGGITPPVAGPASALAGTSYVLRRFRDGRVTRVPTEAELDVVRAGHPTTMLTSLYREGQRLSDNPFEFDGYSYRYAIVNVAASSMDDVDRHVRSIRSELDYEFVDEPGLPEGDETVGV